MGESVPAGEALSQPLPLALLLPLAPEDRDWDRVSSALSVWH